MTDFTNLTPAQSYGDIISLGSANPGTGLTNVLVNVQDGLGNNSPMQISLTSVNFSTNGGNTFQLNGVTLTATSTNLNLICGAEPNFTFSDSALVLPVGNTASRPIGQGGEIRYNFQTAQFEGYIGGVGWRTFQVA